MNLYHCMIDLKDDAKAIGFAAALDRWIEYLSAQGLVGQWRLLRRKLNLSADSCRDFLLEVEVADLAALDALFRHACGRSDEVDRMYHQVHAMIARVDCGLYRVFPDPERVERAAIL